MSILTLTYTSGTAQAHTLGVKRGGLRGAELDQELEKAREEARKQAQIPESTLYTIFLLNSIFMQEIN
jgi:hypothetical protein